MVNSRHQTTWSIRTAAVLIAAVFAVTALMLPAEAEPAFAAKAKKPARVKITTAKLSGTKIIVRWKKAARAKKYQVWRKIGAAKWRRVKTQKARVYRFKAAKGKVYRIKVRGVNGKKRGRFSAVRKVRGPKKTPVKPEPEPEPAVKIVTQPADATVKDGEDAVFTIAAEAAEAGQELTYQWFRTRTGDTSQGTRLTGETSPELRYRTTILDNGMYFFCIVTAGTDKVKTEAAKLTVEYGDRVYILTQPQAVDGVEGKPAALSFEARGGGALTYQWYVSDSAGNQGGEPLAGATEDTLSFKRLYVENSGKYYYCVVTNTSVVDGADVVTEARTNAVKVSVEGSPEHAKAVADIKALIAEHGVMSTSTVEIDGLDFYVIANEKGKALLLAKQPSSYYEHSISDNDRWDCNYEGLDFYGEGSCYADDDIDDEMEGHYGAIVELNTDYLDKNPTVDCIAAPVKTYTLKGGEFTMSEIDYFCLTRKTFLLTQGDVTGMYAGENSAPYDYTFNLTQHWEHFGNPMPAEIANLVVDGEVVPWFVRSPYQGWLEDWTPARVSAVSGSGYPQVEAVEEGDGVKAYARPAFWVEIGQ